MASTYGQGQWNLGTWNNSVSGAVITGIGLTSSLNDVTINATLFEGMQAKVIDILKKKESQVVLLQILDHPQTIWFNLKEVTPDRDLITDYSNL